MNDNKNQNTKDAKASSAILLLTNKASKQIELLYNSLTKQLADTADIYVAYHSKEEEKIPESIEALNHFEFNNSILSNLGYTPIEESLLPGSNHFPLLSFFLQNKNYEYYSIIEDDVRFTGNWSDLFSSQYSLKGDFYSCCIRRWKDEPNWYWWNTLQLGSIRVDLENLLASFNPIYTISKLALEYIHKCLSSGWIGHHEVLFPTLLYAKGFKIFDIGGDGEFVPKGYENRYYISPYSKDKSNITMRYRPVFSDNGAEKNKLYHPVKNF